MLIMSEYFKHVNRLRKRHSENWANAFWLPFKRNHRKYGGLLIHLGVVLMVWDHWPEGLQQEIQVTLDRERRAELAGYNFNLRDLNSGATKVEYRAADWRSRDETLIGVLYPQRDIYLEMGLAVTQPSTRSNLAKDIYAILVDYDAETQNAATFRLYINPLVNWLWIGVGVMTLGTLVALLPDEKSRIRNPTFSNLFIDVSPYVFVSARNRRSFTLVNQPAWRLFYTLIGWVNYKGQSQGTMTMASK